MQVGPAKESGFNETSSFTDYSLSIVKPFRASAGPNFKPDLAKISQYAQQNADHAAMASGQKARASIDVPSQDDKVRYRPNPFTRATVCASLSLSSSAMESRQGVLSKAVAEDGGEPAVCQT